LLLSRPVEDLILDHVDSLVEVFERRVEAVGEAVHESVEKRNWLLERRRPLRIALLQAFAGRRLVLADGDEKAFRVETVHLDEPVLVGGRSRAVEHEEGEVVVVLELRALAEVLRILEREWMEPEDVAQKLEVIFGRIVQVEPEELAARQARLDGYAVVAGLDRTVAIDQL
jgi:hypothetical protein